MQSEKSKLQRKNSVWTFLAKYISSDAAGVNEFLHTKHWTLAIPNWILRAVGQPVFVNNPYSGLLILIALFFGDPWVALCGTICLLAAIATAFAVKQEYSLIESGVCTFHGLLIGLLLGVSVDREWYPLLILPLIILGSASVYVANGVGNIYKVWNLPALTLPFCLLTFIFLGAFDSTSATHFPLKATPDAVFNTTTLEWGKVFLSIPISVGQVYAYDGLLTGCFISAAICLASPILALHALIGGFISAFTAIGLSAPPLEIYSGLWGYSAVLTSEAVGGFFFRLTPHSHILAWLGGVLTTLVHATLSRCFSQLGLPVLTLPFVLTTSILLAFTSKSPQFSRIPMGKLSSPERHLSLKRDVQTGEIDQASEMVEGKSHEKRSETDCSLSTVGLDDIPVENNLL